MTGITLEGFTTTLKWFAVTLFKEPPFVSPRPCKVQGVVRY